MKLTTIIGSAIAAAGLAACGSTATPTVPPTLVQTVAPSVGATTAPTGTPTATPSPSESPPPSASASPSLSSSPTPCDAISGAICPAWGFTTTCAVPGSAQGGSVVITFTGGTPDTIVIDGNTLDVSSNPFTYGPLTVGRHMITLEGFDASLNVAACAVPTTIPPG
jgi:hypothetical protein